MKRKVLIIIDSLMDCRDINLHLNHDGTEVSFALSVQEALGYLLVQDYNWVIINAPIAEADRNLLISALDRLKSRPLLMILNQEYSKKMQDYRIEKSEITILKLQEFLINAKGLFHDVSENVHVKTQSYTIMPCSNLYIDQKSRRAFVNHMEIVLTRNHMEIVLTRKEFDILWIFSSNPGRVFTFEQLHQEFWDETYTEAQNSVKCRIRRLRKKLGDVKCIESVRGVGYRFKHHL